MTDSPRSENDIFADLLDLARSPCYVHAIAQICFRDNIVFYGRKIVPSDLEKRFSLDRLIRTEITTILGLLVRGPIDFTQPGYEHIEELS